MGRVKQGETFVGQISLSHHHARGTALFAYPAVHSSFGIAIFILSTSRNGKVPVVWGKAWGRCQWLTAEDGVPRSGCKPCRPRTGSSQYVIPEQRLLARSA